MKIICSLIGLMYFTAALSVEPIADKIPVQLKKHSDIRIDNYFWLKDKTNPKVIDYLRAENAYSQEKMKGTEELQDKLYGEMRSRIKEDDTSVPYKYGDYYYYTRTLTGKEHRLYCRKKGLEGKEEIMVDVNELAQGKPYIRVPQPIVHPMQTLMAYAMDVKGDRIFTIFFKDLSTGKNLEQKIEGVTGNMEWSEVGKVLFYTQHDPQTLRSDKVFKFDLETGNSTLVYEEKDEKFEVYLYKTLSQKFLMISSNSTLSSEIRYAPADNPAAPFIVFWPREEKHEYSVDDGKDRFFVHTNWKAKNFRLMEVDYTDTAKKNWKQVVAHRKNVLIEDVDVFNGHLVLTERKNGLTDLHILDRKNYTSQYIQFPEPIYMAWLDDNEEYQTDVIRFGFESLNRPETTFDYNRLTKKSVLLKEKEVPGYNSADYLSERLMVPTKSGVKIPLSLVYKKGFKRNATSPLLIYGYGSYGSSMDPYFSSSRISLLDRGFVFAIAHIRGGSELGRSWYENGKFLKKKNTFNDFIAATEFLVKQKYADPKHLYAMGESAGGLLMGAVINLKPKLYHGVIAGVPFVDVVTTMLDSSIPLTTGEYEEWGNPNDKKYYHYMKSYSPYDNVRAQAYPHLLVTAGLNDSQVGFWEPAKWVAKLRELRTDKSKLLLLKTEMDVGHGGKSGRFEYLRDLAFEYAFLIRLLAW